MQTNISKLKNTLLAVFQKYRDTLVFGYLFGSMATGGEGRKSDIDVAVFVQDPASFNFSDKLMLHGEFCRHLQRNDIDLIIVNQTRNLILLNKIVQTGIVIWDNDPIRREKFELLVQHRAIDFKCQREREMRI